jgi:hypothetical protein
MTAAGFRRIALMLDGAVEAAHMGHPDFRVGGRIFATLHAGDKTGMVKLPPDRQQEFVRDHPKVFEMVNGAWGLQGATLVHLAAAKEEILGEALTLAWQGAMAHGPTRKQKTSTSRGRR